MHFLAFRLLHASGAEIGNFSKTINFQHTKCDIFLWREKWENLGLASIRDEVEEGGSVGNPSYALLECMIGNAD